MKAQAWKNFVIDRYRSEKGLAWMLLAVSALLVVITASGIVGMSTLWVAQRRKQIGIRRALGAQRSRYFVLFHRPKIGSLPRSGIVVGTMLAFGLNQVLVSSLNCQSYPSLFVVTHH